MLFKVTFLSLTFFSLVRSECDLYGKIDSSDWINEPIKELKGCQGSYFTIDILSNEIDDENPNYILTIEDPQVILENETISQDLSFATSSEETSISVEADQNLFFPYEIEYREIKQRIESFENNKPNGSFNLDNIKPNSKYEITLHGLDEYKLLEMEWKLPLNLGFMAIDNGNGRISMLTNPVQNKQKVSKRYTCKQDLNDW